MTHRETTSYYVARAAQLLRSFDEEAQRWHTILTWRYGPASAGETIISARAEFAGLLPRVPYIGGEEHHLTGSLVGSVRCLALYRTMASSGGTAAEAGKVAYDAVLHHASDYAPHFPQEQRLSEAELMQRRRERATRSQQRLFAGDYVYTFVEGDGLSFDYGYDFHQCATDLLFRGLDAAEFTPYFCFLDFPKCELAGLGLTRSMTLSEGYARCDFRFRLGGTAQQEWPPPFLVPRRSGEP